MTARAFPSGMKIYGETLSGELDARIRDVLTGPDSAVYLLTGSPEGRVLRVVAGEGE